MVRISGPIRTQWAEDSLHMIVLEEATYTDNHGRAWTIPAGFVTDGASIPQPFWGLIGDPFTGPYRIPAVFHDAAYATLGITKEDADQMLRDFAIEMGCPHWKAEALYAGVRIGGASPYAADQAANAITLTTTTQRAEPTHGSR